MAFTARLGTADSRLGNIQLGLGAVISTSLSASGGIATTAGTVALTRVLVVASGTATAGGGASSTPTSSITSRLPTSVMLGDSTRTARIGAYSNAVRLSVHDNEAIVSPNTANVLMPV